MFRLPQSLARASRYVISHAGPGLVRQSTGEGHSGNGAIISQTATFVLRQVPAGIYSAQLGILLVPWHGAALLRIDAEVIVSPRRTEAERLHFTDPGALTIRATVEGRNPHHLRRVITSPSQISKLIRLVNSLPAEPHVSLSCPAGLVAYRAALKPAGHHPADVVTDDGCNLVHVSVAGHSQPALQDAGGRVFRLLHRLLRATHGAHARTQESIAVARLSFSSAGTCTSSKPSRSYSTTWQRSNSRESS